jgi:hypothetical protein
VAGIIIKKNVLSNCHAMRGGSLIKTKGYYWWLQEKKPDGRFLIAKCHESGCNRVCQTITIPEYLKTKYKRFDFPEKRHY